MSNTLSKKEAIKYLNIDEKHFNNYHQSSGEIIGKKESGKWVYEKNFLDSWKTMKKNRTVFLSRKEYEKCFVFAIQMAYGTSSSAGTFGATRTEVEQADNWILGIMAEFGLKKFLNDKYSIKIDLDTEPHPDRGITAQDIVKVNGKDPGLEVSVKSSKPKSWWNVISPTEYEDNNRNSDVYVFARVYLPSDHLFRILSGHLFFKNARNLIAKKVKQQNTDISKIQSLISKISLEINDIDEKKKNLMKLPDVKKRISPRKNFQKIIKSKKEEIIKLEKMISKTNIFKDIEKMPDKIPIWICGFSEHSRLHEVTEIPGQKFTGSAKPGGGEYPGYRFVANVSDMKNSDADWTNFVNRLKKTPK